MIGYHRHVEQVLTATTAAWRLQGLGCGAFMMGGVLTQQNDLTFSTCPKVLEKLDDRLRVPRAVGEPLIEFTLLPNLEGYEPARRLFDTQTVTQSVLRVGRRRRDNTGPYIPYSKVTMESQDTARGPVLSTWLDTGAATEADGGGLRHVSSRASEEDRQYALGFSPGAESEILTLFDQIYRQLKSVTEQ